jgi:hypothetical protein
MRPLLWPAEQLVENKDSVPACSSQRRITTAHGDSTGLQHGHRILLTSNSWSA